MKPYLLAEGLNNYIDTYRTINSGFKTGFDEFDKLFDGLGKGGLMVIGGRLNMGKTATLISLAQKASSDHQKAVLYISTKETLEACTARYLSAVTQIELEQLYNLSVDENEINRYKEKIDASKIYFIASKSPFLPDIIKSFEDLNLLKNIDAVLIDDITNIVAEADFFGNSNMKKVLKGVKWLADQYQIPVIATIDLKQTIDKRGGDRKAHLTDFYHSKFVEKYADFIASVYQPALYDIIEDENGYDVSSQLELILLKNSAGPSKSIYFHINKSTLELSKFEFKIM